MKYAIFGAGDTGRAALDVFGKENILCFIDNNIEKQNAGFEGYPVYSLEQAMGEIDKVKLVIAVTPKYENEIKRQLELVGITDYIMANAYIYETRRKRLLSRKDCLSIYKKSIQWIFNHTIDSMGIAINSSELIVYPEVTGYYIPSLLRWGYRELAQSYAKGLIQIQRPDGAWNGPHDDTPYVFDTGQILKGLIAILPMMPEALEPIVRGANWLLTNMQPNGRLTTPNSDEWGEDDSVCSELIHIYTLSPLVELSVITNDSKYRKAADKILSYYITEYKDRILNFCHLSHFHAYLMEALIDMQREDVARLAMKNMEIYQKTDGSIPAYNDCDWVCSTGLFQLALVWFRLGDTERGKKAFDYACRLQNNTGGWYGSYLYDSNEKESNSYFPLSEISWANKYFLDALYYKNKSEFDEYASQFLDSIDINDGRYLVIKKLIGKCSPGSVIVDVGCGKGRYIKNLKKDYPSMEYVGIDISKEVLNYIKYEDISIMEGTLTSIPLNNNTVDVTYTCEALEHAVDIESSISEMARVTKSGGYIIVLDKNKDKLGQLEISEWEQWFNKSELKGLMEKYCSDVSIIDDIEYEDKSSDGLFCVWYGIVR